MNLDAMHETNKSAVRRLYERVWNLGELDVLDEIVTSDFVGHRSDRPDDLGREALRQSVIALCEAFPNGKFTIEEMVGEGDSVAVRYTARATHKGPFRELQPTGNEIIVEGLALYRIEEGQIAERWEILDQLSLMQQLRSNPADRRVQHV